MSLAALGALAFLVGVYSADAGGVWSIYLVNLVFWSGLAVTGPAIAGMMQLTEARWSPSVRRIALTTAGFLPVVVRAAPRPLRRAGDALRLGHAHRSR